MKRACAVISAFMRRLACNDKYYLIQSQNFESLFRDCNMSFMNGVKCSAEKSCFFHIITPLQHKIKFYIAKAYGVALFDSALF